LSFAKNTSPMSPRPSREPISNCQYALPGSTSRIEPDSINLGNSRDQIGRAERKAPLVRCFLKLAGKRRCVEALGVGGRYSHRKSARAPTSRRNPGLINGSVPHIDTTVSPARRSSITRSNCQRPAALSLGSRTDSRSREVEPSACNPTVVRAKTSPMTTRASDLSPAPASLSPNTSRCSGPPTSAPAIHRTFPPRPAPIRASRAPGGMP